VANLGTTSVQRVRASDGKVLETWTGAVNPLGVLVAMGKVVVTGFSVPGRLFLIDPSQAAGAVTTVATNLGGSPAGITFDGARIWTYDFPNDQVQAIAIDPRHVAITRTIAGLGKGPGHSLVVLPDRKKAAVTAEAPVPPARSSRR
jgi:hypothetical protein